MGDDRRHVLIALNDMKFVSIGERELELVAQA
jgi:hypothetical protein